MNLRLIAAGTRLPDWINAGVAEYSRRFGRGITFELVEVPLARLTERMKNAIGDGDYVVALEVAGKAMSTPELSQWLASRMAGGRDLAFLIGGPEGLDAELSRLANFRWSLSPLTWPHGLVRVMATEQLYRAHSLLQGHPYHRA